MRLLDTIWFRLRALFQRQQTDAELEAEFRFHIERETAANVSRGMSPEDARRKAMAEFGGFERFKEECRDERHVRWLQDIGQDVRHGFRLLRKNALFSATVIGTLALGIGATSTIFTLVNGVLLRPVVYAQPDRIVSFTQTSRGEDRSVVSVTNYNAWRASVKTLSEMALYTSTSGVFKKEVGGTKSPNLKGGEVTASFFSVLGVKPLLGRVFSTSDETVGAQPVIVLSNALWRSRFNGDSSIINQLVTVDDTRRTVVGVMPDGFDVPSEAKFWQPLDVPPPTDHSDFYFFTVARLRDGTSIAGAQAELLSVLKRSEQLSLFPDHEAGVAVVSLRERQFGSVKKPLMLMFGAVAVLLLIACVNVANLTLAHAASRHREFALRLSLGAGRWRLVRQLFIESLLLAAIGGAIGSAMPYLLVDAFVKLSPSSVARLSEFHVNGVVLAFTATITMLSALAFGLAPALAGSRANAATSLAFGSTRDSKLRTHNTFRSALIVVEVAAALVLLTGAGLLTRSFARALAVNIGFRAEHTLATYIQLPFETQAQQIRARAAFDDLARQVRAIPGVESATLSNALPMMNVSMSQTIKRSADDEHPLRVAIGYVDSDFARTLGLHLIKGRFIDSTDRIGSIPSMMITASTARIYFPGVDPLGKPFPNETPKAGSAAPVVVGIVDDVAQTTVEAKPIPQVYFASAQNLVRPRWITVHTSLDAQKYQKAISDIVAKVDASIEAPDISDLEKMVSKSLAPRRFNSLLIGSFAGLALILAMLGLYGLMAYTVISRTRELGIRMALGAQQSNVLQLVLRKGLLLTTIGVALGVSLSYSLARLLSSMVFDVQVHDAMTFVLVPIGFGAIAFLACYFPARRATRVSPMMALRAE
ncbi:MAG: ABC transporter permease [Gemmatimonadaceae bacterium]